MRGGYLWHWLWFPFREPLLTLLGRLVFPYDRGHFFRYLCAVCCGYLWHWIWFTFCEQLLTLLGRLVFPYHGGHFFRYLCAV